MVLLPLPPGEGWGEGASQVKLFAIRIAFYDGHPLTLTLPIPWVHGNPGERGQEKPKSRPSADAPSSDPIAYQTCAPRRSDPAISPRRNPPPRERSSG